MCSFYRSIYIRNAPTRQPGARAAGTVILLRGCILARRCPRILRLLTCCCVYIPQSINLWSIYLYIYIYIYIHIDR